MSDKGKAAATPVDMSSGDEADPGYKAPAKATISELLAKDKGDPQMEKYKQSLLGAAAQGGAIGDAKDARRVVIVQLGLLVSGRPDILIDTSTPEALEKFKHEPLVVKEGSEYQLKILFRVQHEIVMGLKYQHTVKRKGIPVEKVKEMVGSYPPKQEPYEKKLPAEEAPSGMMARGTYHVHAKLVDDDNVTHFEMEFLIEIKKDWS